MNARRYGSPAVGSTAEYFSSRFSGPPSYIPPSYQPPTVIPVQAQAFQPTHTAQVPTLVQVGHPPAPSQAIMQAKPPQAPIQAYTPPATYGYGWLHDPLYYTAVASPPPMRPQLQGESFFERVVKNAGLAMLESLFLQSFLAVRQLVLPPRPVVPGQENTIDVTPKQ